MLEFAVPPRPLRVRRGKSYVRFGLPLAGRAVSPGWSNVGDFLGPSIRSFWERWPLGASARGLGGRRDHDVQARLLSLGGGIVMWGVRAD